MRLILAIWLALSAVAAPPLFRAQNQAVDTAFSPQDVAGMIFWIAADDAANRTVSSGVFDEIRDKSGNGHDFQSTGSSRPALSAAALNGRDIMVSDGVNDLMDAVVPIDTTGSWTVIAVQRRGSAAAISGALMNYGGFINPGPPFSALDYPPLGATFAATRTDQRHATMPSHAWHVYTTKNDAGTPSVGSMG